MTPCPCFLLSFQYPKYLAPPTDLNFCTPMIVFVNDLLINYQWDIDLSCSTNYFSEESTFGGSGITQIEFSANEFSNFLTSSI